MPPTLEEYEAFIYALPTSYPTIQHALLSFIRLGPLTATVRAELFFTHEDCVAGPANSRFRRWVHSKLQLRSVPRGGEALLVRFMATSSPS